jgi:hypothetical protein
MAGHLDEMKRCEPGTIARVRLGAVSLYEVGNGQRANRELSKVTEFSGRRRARALASVHRPSCPDPFQVGTFHEDLATPSVIRLTDAANHSPLA